MAEMTLEKADRILEKFRNQERYRGMSDYLITRTLDVRCSQNSVYALLLSVILLAQQVCTESMGIFGVTLCCVMFGSSVFFYFRGRQHARIRELFEAQTPQYLNQLDPSVSMQTANSNTPEEW